MKAPTTERKQRCLASYGIHQPPKRIALIRLGCCRESASSMKQVTRTRSTQSEAMERRVDLISNTKATVRWIARGIRENENIDGVCRGQVNSLILRVLSIKAARIPVGGRYIANQLTKRCEISQKLASRTRAFSEQTTDRPRNSSKQGRTLYGMLYSSLRKGAALHDSCFSAELHAFLSPSPAVSQNRIACAHFLGTCGNRQT
jgi:hypothetical protein